MIIDDPTKTRSLPLWLRLRAKGAKPPDILRHFRVERPEVDVHGMVRAMGIEVKSLPSTSDFSGFTNSENVSRPVISIRTADSSPRQRFTLAHELGHLMMHELGVPQYRRDHEPGSEEKETEADAFAGELLMPFGLLHPYAMKFGPDAKLLARYFGVSEASMSIRLMQMVGMRR